ncbi:hypothetical protein OG453_10310 [Streptomyces sp. NBC_01381]|uniref:hypothetical protein n=1 Tax=Streptomyces sp. NBC_01381 TaxID=2903845 RepID=UPI002257EC11|nr:hypothetical protein [Streptomyces sp. NBC_01381]MCX4667053.1 hypothetical protein [Streptomyces sp. NBC_01381]
MRRGLVHAMAWSLATGAAVTLSWWGVHTVMAGTAYDPPRAVPLSADGGDAEPLSSSTHRPDPTPTTGATHSSKPSKPSKSQKPSKSPEKDPPKPPPSGSSTPDATAGNVKSYSTDGGRVVFDLGKDSATLVSATPAAGWSVQVWKQDTWIRVEFTSGADRVSAFCTWHDHAPAVEINKY